MKAKKKSILLLDERLKDKYKSKKASSSDNEDDSENVPERAIYTAPSKVQDEPKPKLEKREPLAVPCDVWQALELFTRNNIKKCAKQAQREALDRYNRGDG